VSDGGQHEGQHEGPAGAQPPDSPGEEEIMGGFRRTRSGVSARFTAGQAAVLRTLVSQIADLVGGEQDEAGTVWQAVTDPAGAGSGPGGPAPGQPAGADDLAAMLGAGGPTSPPDDPVLARLFPDAYSDDEAAAGEFRKYTEQSLRSGKQAAAQTVLATLPEQGGRVRLADDDAQAWLRALNDVRLALGVRLEITEDYEDEMAPAGWADPRSAYLEVYHWLGYLQDSLVQALW
jgi:hypothetical protein